MINIIYFILFIFAVIILFLNFNLYKSILLTDNLNLYSHFKIFNFLLDDPKLWHITKIVFIITLIFSTIIQLYLLFKFFKSKKIVDTNNYKAPNFSLLIGRNEKGNNIYIPEKGLYQNFLVTGTIGSGKTSSALYPFTKQLMNYKATNKNKLSFLILDVKGNYYSKVLEFARKCNRLNDVIVIKIRW